jgi:hypothetical protein
MERNTSLDARHWHPTAEVVLTGELKKFNPQNGKKRFRPPKTFFFMDMPKKGVTSVSYAALYLQPPDKALVVEA